MRVKNYGRNVMGKPWDYSPVKPKKINKVSLQLWREDLGEWFTIRRFDNKPNAMEYANVKGFDPEDFRII